MYRHRDTHIDKQKPIKTETVWIRKGSVFLKSTEELLFIYSLGV